MAEISVGDSIGEGFSLIKRRFGVVATWGFVQVAFLVVVFAVLAPFFMTNFMEVYRQAKLGGAGTPPDLQGMMQTQALTYLFDIVNLLLASVINCAVFRSVIQPEQSRFAYLRVGAPELLMAILTLGAGVVFGIGLAVAIIPLGIIIGISVAVHAGAVAAIIGVVGGIGIFVGAVYVALRFVLLGPMLVDTGRVAITEAWALTKGKVFSLFAIALVLVMIVIAGEFILVLVLGLLGFGYLSAIAGGLSNLPVLFQQGPQVIFGKLAPILIILAIVWVPLTGCVVSIMAAPWARAYRDLRPPRNVADTFA
jgi:hypothetical protein